MKMNLQYFAVGEGYSPNWMNKYEIGVAATVGENGKLVPPTTVHELADGIQEATPSQDKAGRDRIVFFRHTEPDGRVIQGNATLSGIVHTGGGPNNRGNFEMQVSFNGVPEDTKPDTTPEG